MKSSKNKVKVFVIAGEVSGDQLGAEIMRAAKGVDFIGIGGASMKAEGLDSLFPISDLAVMALSDVVLRAGTLLGRIKQTAAAIVKEHPDVVLTIDSPSFAVRVVKRARRLIAKNSAAASLKKIKFYHVVAPMVWIWGASRAKKHAAVFDRMFAFFDFEAPYFEKYGLPVTTIGYPVYNMVIRNIRPAKDRPFTLLMPGSRLGDTRNLMPVYGKFAAMHPEMKFAVMTTEITEAFIKESVKTWAVSPTVVPFKERYDYYNMARMAICNKGTAVAEMAIMHIPTILVSKMNWLNEMVARFVLRVKYRALVNIFADKLIVPELCGGAVTAKNMDKIVRTWDTNKMVEEMKAADNLWHKNTAPMDIVAASLITNH